MNNKFKTLTLITTGLVVGVAVGRKDNNTLLISF